MDGVVIARHLRRRGTKVIDVNGYASDVRLIGPNAAIVPKAYRSETVLRAVEQIVAATAGGRSRLALGNPVRGIPMIVAPFYSNCIQCRQIMFAFY